jgi:hypothetical protein
VSRAAWRTSITGRHRRTDAVVFNVVTEWSGRLLPLTRLFAVTLDYSPSLWRNSRHKIFAIGLSMLI